MKHFFIKKIIFQKALCIFTHSNLLLNRYMKQFVLIIISFLCLFSCKENSYTPQPTQLHTKYIVLETPHECNFTLTQITIDVVAGIRDTQVWHVRDIMSNEIVDTLDYTLYRVERNRRKADTLPWNPYTVYSIRAYSKSLVRVWENTPYVIMQFPEIIGKTWNGNEYNTKPAEQYSYTAINTTDTIGQTIYDSVLVITQQNFKSLYTYQFKEERYAYGVGLISKTTYDVESQPNHANINLNLPIEQRITKGTIEIYERKN